ncbi:hypothetical protein M9H77_16511 [Catharanthus roseus]|uniref:Uncharacterized protein n=1 Tax=Catharanthus roseus TaxID=4058 RepID=A0ACC0B1Z1_CATRO|nr:hypothetical protein M9H77_16511 [Catharanthus roseus]
MFSYLDEAPKSFGEERLNSFDRRKASEKDAFCLYNDYAFRLGCSIRKGKQNFKEGSSTKHNHELCATNQRHFMRSNNTDHLQELKDSEVSIAARLSVLKKKVGGSPFVGFTSRNAYNSLRSYNLDDRDANALIQRWSNEVEYDVLRIFWCTSATMAATIGVVFQKTRHQLDRKSQASMELKLGPMTRARTKKLKTSNGNEDNGMVAYMEEALKNKFGEFGDQGKASKEGHLTANGSSAPTVAGRLLQAESLEFTQPPLTVLQEKEGDPWEGIESKLQSKMDLHQTGFIVSTEGQLPTQSHQEGTSDPTRMNLNETLRSMQQSIKGLARQLHSVARDIEELKRGKSTSTMEQRVGDVFGGVNSPHHQRPYENMSTQGCHDMSAHNPYSFHEGGFQGRPQARGGRRRGQGGKGYYRLHEKVPRHEAWREDNLKQLEEENWLSVGEGHPTTDGSPVPTIAGRLSASRIFRIHTPITDCRHHVVSFVFCPKRGPQLAQDSSRLFEYLLMVVEKPMQVDFMCINFSSPTVIIMLNMQNC